MDPMRLEPMTSSYTLFLQVDEVLIELNLITCNLIRILIITTLNFENFVKKTEFY